MAEQLLTLPISKAINLMKHVVAAGQNIFLHGQPGVGKTQGIKDLCKQLTAADVCSALKQPGDETRPVRLVLIAATTMESVDVRGLIAHQDNRTVWHPPTWIPLDNENGGEPCIVFIDEFPQADESVQLALQKLIDRDLDCVSVSRRAVFIMAGNRLEDNSGVRLIPQHIRRRACHIGISSDSKLWCEWAEQNDVHPILIDYILANPRQLNTFDPDSEDLCYATPASVTALSDVLKVTPRDLWNQMAQIRCGAAWASGFTQFRAVHEKCPPVEKTLLSITSVDDAGNKIPEDSGILRIFLNNSIRVVRESKDDKARCGKLFDAIVKVIAAVSRGDHKEYAGAGAARLMALGREGIVGNILSTPEGAELLSQLTTLMSA